MAVRIPDMPAQDAALEKAFESEVRPILTRHCIRCHQEKTRKGGLDLTTAASVLKGGDSGPALLPGNAAESLILDAIGYESDLRMPPKGRLSDDEIKSLKTWVVRGAAWPKGAKLIPPADATETAESSGHTGPKLRKAPFELTDEDRRWWSLRPIAEPPQPPSISNGIAGNSIDAFLLDKLQAKGLRYRPEATRRELIRRLSYDLLGLPPTFEEVTAFENDERPDAWERLIDRMLASPHYGERWGRHWLDLVRFAETNGYERDGDKPGAWRYRDYVISSFNADKPYDRFLREQLAGDEMAGPFDADRIVARSIESPVTAAILDRMGGHLVQGHVDAVGTVRRAAPDLEVGIPPHLNRYVVEKGSITVDGVSLTVVDALEDGFTVAVIPHTLDVTTLGHRDVGDGVNLEVDVMAKYTETLVAAYLSEGPTKEDPNAS